MSSRTASTPRQADSIARRSAQSALYLISEAMVRWIAPILSFTAEEIWRNIPGERGESVFLETWFELPEMYLPDDADRPNSSAWRSGHRPSRCV